MNKYVGERDAVPVGELEAEDRAPEPIELAREAPLQWGSIRVEPPLRRLVRDDGLEALVEPRVMQVLIALLKADGRILSRNDLLASCWRGVVVGEDAIDRVIGRVRRLADGVGRGEFRLETVTKVGYRLVPTGGGRAANESSPAAARGPSICVLPFANMSDDPQQEYFSDGISEDIVTDLGKVSSLFVVARTTAFTFRGRSVDAPAIARQLNVGYVLEGSVRKAGGRVRVTAQLVDGATGGQVWAERYDRDLKDIFALQDEISEAIVAALKCKLLPEEKLAIEQRGASSPEAYNLFLVARRYYLNGHDGDLRGLQAVERLCRRAVAIDPGFARAWALLGVAQTALHYYHCERSETGLAAIERALILDAELAEAHAVKARHLWQLGRPEEAKQEIETALRLNPESWEANLEGGRFHYLRGDLREAIRRFEKAATLMEGSITECGMLLSCYAAEGDAEGVRQAARMTLERAEQALTHNPSNGAAFGFGVTALAALGDMERTRDWIYRARLVEAENSNMLYNFACAASAHLGDLDLAFELLEEAFATSSASYLRYAEQDPDLAAARADPRFEALLRAADARLANEG